jgi:glyoxylase-like metal-dependent hydrolase (beta-lactamase superfamily II)
MAEVELDVIVTAKVKPPLGYVHRGSGPTLVQVLKLVAPGGKTLDSPCLAYVVRHPTAGTLLIDTGMHADAASDLRKEFGLAMSLVFRGIEPAAQPFDEQLRRCGVDPCEALRVIMTHLHVDHTSAMRLLPEATFVIAREEWEAAHQPRAAGKGYVGHHLPPESRAELVDFGADGEGYGPFAQTIDLLGDGSVRLVSTPGHTVGHLSVLLRVAGGREVLVVGDAAYTLRSIEEQILPLFTVSDKRYAATLAELNAFADARPEATLVPSHDPAAWRVLARASEFAGR